jgi:HEAT repeat protein
VANTKKRTVKTAPPVKKAPANKPKSDEVLDALIAKACRGDAIARVGVRERKPAEVMPRLIALFEDESPKVRAAAVALASTPLAFVKLLPLATLLGMLDDPDPKVRAAAAVGFSYSFPYEPFFKPQLAKIKPKLEALLKDADKNVRARAQHALEELQREPDAD